MAIGTLMSRAGHQGRDVPHRRSHGATGVRPAPDAGRRTDGAERVAAAHQDGDADAGIGTGLRVKLAGAGEAHDVAAEGIRVIDLRGYRLPRCDAQIARGHRPTASPAERDLENGGMARAATGLLDGAAVVLDVIAEHERQPAPASPWQGRLAGSMTSTRRRSGRHGRRRRAGRGPGRVPPTCDVPSSRSAPRRRCALAGPVGGDQPSVEMHRGGAGRPVDVQAHPVQGVVDVAVLERSDVGQRTRTVALLRAELGVAPASAASPPG